MMRSSYGAVLLAVLLLGPLCPLAGQTAVQLFEEGESALRREDYYTAIELFKSALERNEHYLGPLVGLAEGYFALSEYEEALAHIEKARKLDRYDTELAGIEGRIRLGLGQFEESERIFNSILETEPNNVDAQFGLAELALAFGKPANAAALFEHALRISPNNRRALLSLVLVFDEMGDYEVSAKYLAQVLDYYPQNATAHYIAAKHMLARKSYSDAEFHSRVALSLSPDYLEPTLLLSNIHLLRGEYLSAIGLLEEVLTDHKEEVLIWYNLGVAYAESGRKDEAIQSYARVFSIQPDDEVARIALENLLLDSTEIGDPVRERFAEYHFDRGAAFLERNYLQKALHELRRGLILAPRSREGRLLFASVYRSLGLEGKYYSELRVLRDLGFDDKEVAVKLEIAESMLRDSVSARWGVSQYDLERYRYRVLLYHEAGTMLHFHGEAEVADYFHHLLLNNDKLELIGSDKKVESFGEAYRDAREIGAGYFAVLSFDEGSRHFAAAWRLYNGRTGALLSQYAVLRTGNDRVMDAATTAASALAAEFPLYAQILAREFDNVLMDAGWVDGLQIDDELVILKREAIETGINTLEFVFSNDDILGKVRVTDIDELISAGTVERDPFFDLINIGDKIISPPKEQQEAPVAVPPVPDDLYRAILKIR
ncbi:MAG: tetratricopeptide repeat protein [Spirochaetales bacterium]|nr:tetratricopeptide repeat protein [Spirochaetales bacterium]